MDLRRAARSASEFWFAVCGVDDEPQLRRGDVSASGVYVQLDAGVGNVGSLQLLTLAPLDRSTEAQVMARVVRVVTLDDLRRDRAAVGTALEFMPESDETARSLATAVQRIHDLEGEREVELTVGIEPRAAVEKGLGPPAGTAARELGVHAVRLETSWPVDEGELVEMELRRRVAPHPLRFRGLAGPTVPHLGSDGETRFAVDLRVVDGDSPAPPGEPAGAARTTGAGSIPDAVDALFAALVEPASTSPRGQHLSGQLSRIHLSSLLALFEMERMSGELQVERGDERARVHLQEGRVVDVERVPPSDGASPRETLGELLRWREGAFELTLGAVARADRVCCSTTALLLDLARQEDEAARPPV